MKKIFLLAALATTTLSAAPAFAFIVPDTTNVIEWTGANVIPPGPPGTPTTGVPVDVVGPAGSAGTWPPGTGVSGFQTTQVDVTRVGTTNPGTKFAFTTFYVDGTNPANIQGRTPRIADVFFDTDGNFDTWEFGFAVKAGSGITQGRLYSNPTFQTSKDRYGNLPFGYGGQFVAPDNSLHDIPVVLTGGTLVTAVTFGNSDLSPDNPVGTPAELVPTSLPYQLSFVIRDSAGLPTNYTAFWATADCGNDAILAPVPVPAALPMFLGALASLGLVGRRRRA